MAIRERSEKHACMGYGVFAFVGSELELELELENVYFTLLSDLYWQWHVRLRNEEDV
jgi:hypothetical protein